MKNSQEDKTMIETLFAKLRQDLSSQEYELTEQKIRNIWQQSTCTFTKETLKQIRQSLQSKQYSKALQLCRAILERNPYFAEAWHLKATTHYKRGEFRLSLEANEKALELEARHFHALSLQARIFMLIGDYRAALRRFERLTIIYPERKNLFQQIKQLRSKLAIS